jgi:hypothetical protein
MQKKLNKNVHLESALQTRRTLLIDTRCAFVEFRITQDLLFLRRHLSVVQLFT